jgi:adenylate kinase family enzyme
MRKVLVGGITGTGKSTLARQVAARLGLPFHEMDALFHGPGWVPRPTFEAEVERITAGAAWVFDSHGYPQVRDLVWSRADTVIWLDYPRRIVMSRVLRRSFARATYDRELWNGNREGFRDWVSADHPVRWAWSQFDNRRADLTARARDPAYGQVSVIRLRHPRDTREWLAALR